MEHLREKRTIKLSKQTQDLEGSRKNYHAPTEDTLAKIRHCKHVFWCRSKQDKIGIELRVSLGEKENSVVQLCNPHLKIN